MDINHDRVWYLKLHWQVLGAMLLGALTGLTFGEGAADAVGWVGDLFMRLLRMVIVPLVLASIVSGVASISGGRAIGRLFGRTLGYYLLRLRHGAFSTALFGQRAGVQSIGRVQLQASENAGVTRCFLLMRAVGAVNAGCYCGSGPAGWPHRSGGVAMR